MRAQIGPNCILCLVRATLSLIIITITVFMSVLPLPVGAGPRYSSRIVETKYGAIRGVILELNSKHLEPVEVFKAVPYAAPPTGQHRFENPKKLTAWRGTKLADTFGPVCPQNYPDVSNRTAALMFMPKGRFQYLKKLVPLLVNQSEDCLTLNIYVPGSGNRGLEAPYSVLFVIHGESYEWGSGNPYDGSVLASYGHVIVITINFRLGILGFIKTRATNAQQGGDSGGGGNMTGNFGLMDIIAALQWTKENIGSFGGDISRITIIGHDTGAALANLLLISKVGKGLTHRAILLSGSALSPWAIIHDPDAIRKEVSNQMACHLDGNGQQKSGTATAATKIDITDDITECLRSKPLPALLGVRLPAVRFMPSWGPFLPWDDIIEAEYSMEHSGESFISNELMLGITTTESYADFSAADIQYGLEEEQRNRFLRTYIRNALTFHLNEIFSAVRNEYTDWDKPVQHPINIRDSTMEALSDGHTVAPLIKVGYLHSRRGAKTYLFHFGYQTKDSEYPQRLGSVRGEDIPYIFGLPLVQGMPFFSQNYSRQDMGVAEAVLNFITNFCKTGDPNDAGHQQAMLHPDYGTTRERTRYRSITWETYETTTQQYLSISLKPKMKSHYRGHKIAVWLNLIPQLHRPGDADITMRHHHFREREPHFYAGDVRVKSYTRPRINYENSVINGVQESRQGTFVPECTPDPTLGEALQDTEEPLTLDDEDVDDDDEELLAKLATRHYYSYTAALGVTVGVGCLLLLLNMLIFAGIYYQRDKSRRKTRASGGGGGSGGGCRRSNSAGNGGTGFPLSNTNQSMLIGGCSSSNGDGDIPMTVRPKNASTSKQHHQQQQQLEPPPSYTMLQQRSPCSQRENNTANSLNKKSVCDTYNQKKQQQGNHHHHHHHHHHHNNQSNSSSTLCRQQKNQTTSGVATANATAGTGTVAATKAHFLPPPMPPVRTSSNPSPQSPIHQQQFLICDQSMAMTASQRNGIGAGHSSVDGVSMSHQQQQQPQHHQHQHINQSSPIRAGMFISSMGQHHQNQQTLSVTSAAMSPSATLSSNHDIAIGPSSYPSSQSQPQSQSQSQSQTQPQLMANTINATAGNSNTSTLKKRVQIQEVTV